MAIPEAFQPNETSDVVIIGGGVIGLTIARALALRGVSDVLLLDRASLGSESSYAAGGMLAPRAEADRADEFFELACKSRDLYPALASALLEETGTDIELDTTGALYLAFTEEDQEEIEQRYAWQTRAGLKIEKLSATEARRLEPGIAADVRAALRFPFDIQVENRRLLTALIAANEKLGVRLLTGTNVESLRIQQGRVAGVETARGFVSTRRVVVAGGAWTALLCESEKSDQRLPRFRIEPVRGQMLCFAAQPPLVRHVIYSPRGYLVPRRDGRLLAGSTTEHAGFTKQVTATGLHTILSHALEISPRVGDLPLVDSWAGLRPRAEDDLPVLGPSEIEGLVYATGHYRNGILLAPITGELIADAIVSNVISPLLKRFSPHRFDLLSVV
jgi:glycine oxidase